MANDTCTPTSTDTQTTNEAILNSDKIEDKLHVIMVVSNPCNYHRRIQLAIAFIKRMRQTPHTILYIVEMTYGDQKHVLTNENDPHHLQLRTDVPLWHKENMVNLGVEKLLPPDWRAFAWIDADIEFDNCMWADQCLRILNGFKDVVQLFTVAMDLDANETVLRFFIGFGYSHALQKKYEAKGINYWHSGYAWAMNRKAYNQLGGLYERSILGSGDYNIAMSLINMGEYTISKEASESYINDIKEYATRAIKLKVGYVPGAIRHHYHGNKLNRQYIQRWQVLIKHKYDPKTHVLRNKDGILVPSCVFPKEMQADIMTYFMERKEDD